MALPGGYPPYRACFPRAVRRRLRSVIQFLENGSQLIGNNRDFGARRIEFIFAGF